MPAIAFGTYVSGEVAGATSATQLPDVKSRLVRIKALAGNAGNVYIGFTSGVTKAAGTTDTTSGMELAAGDAEWFFVDNLNKMYYICDNAGDDISYVAYR